LKLGAGEPAMAFRAGTVFTRSIEPYYPHSFSFVATSPAAAVHLK
jgi:hypothetical protein